MARLQPWGLLLSQGTVVVEVAGHGNGGIVGMI